MLAGAVLSFASADQGEWLHFVAADVGNRWLQCITVKVQHLYGTEDNIQDLSEGKLRKELRLSIVQKSQNFLYNYLPLYNILCSSSAV